MAKSSHLACMSSLSPSYWPIDRLPGLKQLDVDRLQDAGIATTEALLHVAAQKDGKRVLSQQLKTKQERINRWVAMADLARVPAVGCEYCGVLLHAGTIATVQLASAAAPSASPSHSTTACGYPAEHAGLPDNLGCWALDCPSRAYWWLNAAGIAAELVMRLLTFQSSSSLLVERTVQSPQSLGPVNVAGGLSGNIHLTIHSLGFLQPPDADNYALAGCRR